MYCVACGGPVDGVAYCPKCGRATSQSVPKVTVENVYQGKTLQIVGSIASLIGVIVCMGSCTAGDSYESGHSLGIGLLLLALGLILVMIGKLQHWYHAE